MCGLTEPGLQRIWPRSTPSRFTPRSSAPMLSPPGPGRAACGTFQRRCRSSWCRTDADDLDSFLATLTMPRSTRPSRPYRGPRSRTRLRSASGRAVDRTFRVGYRRRPEPSARGSRLRRSSCPSPREAARAEPLTIECLAGEVVGQQQFAHFQLDELEKLGHRQPGRPCSGTRRSPERRPDGRAGCARGSAASAVGGRADEDRAVHLAAPVIMFFT